ncbi:outer dense fiber protein 3-like isoform X6 [Eriocheir sinensis]|uniref:outer dense fiber protein 3-like isoform X6 n=1 Tax=Eriocheir sinensis TaxID=95602 RepID=UPI0021C6A955|nr:outer dense fiber protein 3-like isoform X6 [Eriocheir sinensis]
MRSKMGGQSNGNWTPTKRRGPIAAEFSSPGPAAIALKSSIGTGGAAVSRHRAPAFTMASRHEMKLDKAGPGPGQYNVTGLSNKAGKDEPVAASMHIRPKDPKMYVTPAPCDYSPDKAEAKVVESSPCFSFGIKVENGRASDAPAPNSYNIPSLLGSTKEGSKHSAPSFTMSARAREEEDKMKVPGPGSYNEAMVDKYKTIKSPSFSMGQRTTIPSDHTMKPGPGAHCPEKYNDHGPAFTMAPRLEDGGDKMKVPGPGAYEAGDLNMCREKLPAFTMAPRTTLPGDNTPRPAPNAYAPEKYHDSGPCFTMAQRLDDGGDKMKVPGPGAYEAGDLDKCREKLPAFTMAPRTTLPGDNTPKPAPNAYAPEKYAPSGPKFTMAPRPHEETDKMKVPGPGTYEAGNLDKSRVSQPAFTMAPKTTLPTDKTVKPAPNAYSPDMAESSEIQTTPHFSFGIKHSQYLGKLRDQ